jgi:protein tyrosine phosphatase
VVKRVFRVSHEREGHSKERFITQIHYENWPDGGIPDPVLFGCLLEAIDDLKINKVSPIVVHCSAGIGRSGIFVAVHSIRKTIQRARKWGQHGNTIVVNIPKALIGLRLQRKSLVGSSKQFAFIYEMLAKE